ncbi:peroxiredoxin [Deinococcus yavapaiensis]|uniref:thioredoxin-dependent peroxiredoxin n=1 Tax=Deinococcus yavapaiensis KR-236 TaxID=694435 RepID=A0A318S0L7_9DEIO|nr:peroxiredoxin [Deinococcus yavapaiensis]PYE48962.1 peroxiredoxin Q/BCP [Deinococcus yavapaiensis KR-236]
MTQPETLAPGVPFPPFALHDASGELHTLARYAGRYVVLYAYPKDDTPGCTKEACDFRDNAELREHGAVILGVSRDDADSHAKFTEKYSLNFPLLTDESAEYLKSIDAFGTKNTYGKVSEGVKRSTFLIAPDGTLVKAWRAVNVEGHAQQVLAALQEHKANHASS